MVKSEKYNLGKWWFNRRIKYNVGLLISGFVSFNLYWLLGELLIFPYDDTFEVTLFTMSFQFVGYFFFILLANVFYFLGYFVDVFFNKNNSEEFRTNLFNSGFIFSLFIPFIIPILIVVRYFVEYY
ncbi:hypothetical protein [Chryseobacterium geocarposphaerae]|uniref:Uncharacterized protein n=1 Tax=Chryseobacterium geocarposphaerae TaxID=1416776 RepID=A0A2M9C0W8_9FLAO|nr:hypothetical protein [Chryseobacterium geocarposphaerae]PJJ64020.1 hypothetical protein CLV73_2373 [Chryseobacterium geocarposphaerae]